MSHDGMDMGPKCTMNMLWNTQMVDTCIVFSWWRVGGYFSFAVSFVVILLLAVSFEYLRSAAGALDRRIAASLAAKLAGRRTRDGALGLVGSDEDELFQEEGLLTGVSKPGAKGVKLAPDVRIMRATVYALIVFVSFFLMLVYMTYNAWFVLAIILGASIGHYMNNDRMVLEIKAETKGMSCH